MGHIGRSRYNTLKNSPHIITLEGMNPVIARRIARNIPIFRSPCQKIMSHNIKQYKIMALGVAGMARSSIFRRGSGMVTPDSPNPSDSPEMVMSYYSNFYPELTTAAVHGPIIKDNRAVYGFRTTIGTRGQEA